MAISSTCHVLLVAILDDKHFAIFLSAAERKKVQGRLNSPIQSGEVLIIQGFDPNDITHRRVR